MNCETARTKLTEYLYEELMPSEKSHLDEHLRSCPSCAERLGEFQKTRSLLGLWEDAVLPAGTHDLLARLPESQSSWFNRLFPQSLRDFLLGTALPAGLALSCALVVIGLTVTHSTARVRPNWSLVVCGLVWGEIYHSLFQRVLAPVRRARRSLNERETALAVLGGMAAFVGAFILALVTPNPMPFETRSCFFPIAKILPYWAAYPLPMIWSFLSVIIMISWLSPHGFSRPRQTILLSAGVYSLLMILDLATYAYFEPYATWTLCAFWSVGVLVGTFLAVLPQLRARNEDAAADQTRR